MRGGKSHDFRHVPDMIRHPCFHRSFKLTHYPKFPMIAFRLAMMYDLTDFVLPSP